MTAALAPVPAPLTTEFSDDEIVAAVSNMTADEHRELLRKMYSAIGPLH